MIQSFAFELKSVTAEGTFEGLASTYGNIDLVGDIVEKGAFVRTLAQGGDERPLLWQHRDPIGLVKLQDSDEGLIARGKLSLGIQQAKDALVLLRDRVVRAMSIGFTTVKDRVDGNVRRLQEVKLWEVSLTAVPANQQAVITTVKSMGEIQRALDSFRSEVARAIQTTR